MQRITQLLRKTATEPDRFEGPPQLTQLPGRFVSQRRAD
jgi:hypothetical protein